MEFEDNLHQIMAEEHIAIIKPELPPGIDTKHSDYYLTDIDKLNIAEYGTPDGFDIPLDPKKSCVSRLWRSRHMRHGKIMTLRLKMLHQK